MDSINENPVASSSFNFANAYLKQLSQLNDLANRYALQFDYLNQYHVLRRIEACIKHKLNTDEKNKIKKYVDVLDRYIIDINKAIMVKRLKQNTTSPAFKELLKFDEYLKYLMDQNNLLMPNVGEED